ncbi:hypothetical protein NK553_18320 [Pseudomonas sp. ZM23]|uniref:Uncharacterized protein n=1 Tax=Pseudomonas triclosanedens TaxID=2961893 RepID=A0ABY6ZRK4_9PSED|nr:hypothetical protein [Pseudomonas triclosanedens]MCP8465910.1 hypothetical protein [Pseudomonas triclosanedens]MCP8472231.1 hypothetical protein [Pseudomonas triclosanedens]MCP8477209.1 hypothetical protein [Pseudomonas triclosanedens]WAI47453.1 hypothetical protein OU419_16895 [Pseudomonas triclosanedens]
MTMIQEPLKWRAKRNRDGDTIKDCWVTDAGYTVAVCRLPDTRYTVTRPGDAAPFAYLSTRDEVVAIIKADMAASEVPA